MEYREFLETKIAISPEAGFSDVTDGDLSPKLFPHQRDIAVWALRGGRRAIFAAFGLGKTYMQLEILRIISERTAGRCLIVCPLGVKQEFAHDARDLNITVQYVRTTAELQDLSTDTIAITNYERVRDGQVSVSGLTAVSLDEAAVLRGYGTKTFQHFLTLFPEVPYRFVATATPAPNRYKELIHYAGFLGVMDTGQALTRFFQRDSQKAGNLTLYPHRERDFWLWMASWACFVQRPSDLGHSDTGYDLPPLSIHWHEIPVDHGTAGTDRDGQLLLLRDTSNSLQDVAREKRDTMTDRVAKAAELVAAEPNRHFILWHDLESERHALCKAMPAAKAVYGSQDLDTREQIVIDFAEGRLPLLATKPSISGSGCNFQRHCSASIFVGITNKFNDLIQAIHRTYRFLQNQPVDVHIIYAESEREVRQTIEKKWAQHETLTARMSTLIREYGLNSAAIRSSLNRSIGVERRERRGEIFTAVNNDCVIETAEMTADSVDLIVTSIPFGNHYEYTASYNDFGHNLGNDEFFRQMDFLTPQLLRILRPGRVYCCHVKDRILFGNVTGTGMPTVDPFHAHTIFHTCRHGFAFMGMITIETDVVRENNQTYRLGWTEQCKDGTKMGVGCPEYLLLFRKLPSDTSTAYADVPVTKDKSEYTRGRWQIDARAKWNSSGNRFLTREELQTLPVEAVNSNFMAMHGDAVYNYDRHVETANTMDEVGHLPATFETLRVPARTPHVWHDVNRMGTLNADQRRRQLANHICPLQFDIVDRCVTRYSNPGELVFDPFGGLMTVPLRALKLGRHGAAVELNTDYWQQGCVYLAAAERDIKAPTLFDLETVAAPA